MMFDVFIEVFIKDFDNKTKVQKAVQSFINAEIDALTKPNQIALLNNADRIMEKDDFQD